VKRQTHVKNHRHSSKLENANAEEKNSNKRNRLRREEGKYEALHLMAVSFELLGKG